MSGSQSWIADELIRMFCFITSLRAPQVSDDWPRVCELFERTAMSVFNQTTPDFRLIAVCHERPVLKRVFDERLEFITVDLPVPKRNFDSMVVGDKVSKLLVAMKRARELNADYVMPIDADDLISRRIAAYALAHPEADGWFVKRGWRYEYGRWWMEMVDNFNLLCGTCNVLARRWFTFPSEPARERRADAALIVQGHAQVVEAFAAHGAKLCPFPFPAAVYTVRNGENTTRLWFHEEPKPQSNHLRRIAGRTIRGMTKNRALINRRLCGEAAHREFSLITAAP